MWIFAYGSLIFRPAFTFIERRRAYVGGWSRRFWQGSPDHRGVPEAPGRVVTLVPSTDETCGGCAYRIDTRESDGILAALDAREQAGFERRLLPLHDAPGSEAFAEGITWVAGAANAHFLGPLPEREIAAFIRGRHGPSGSNAEYLLRLVEALRALEVVDPHVEEIAMHLSESGSHGASTQTSEAHGKTNSPTSSYQTFCSGRPYRMNWSSIAVWPGTVFTVAENCVHARSVGR
jgi:cation transport protein ChaC